MPVVIGLVPIARQRRKLWRIHSCSSWTRCTCLLLLVWCQLPDSAENCGESTVAVLGQGVHACCNWSGAESQTAQKTCGIPQVQFLDKLFMPVVGVWCPWPDSAGNLWYSTGAVLGQGLHARLSVSGAGGQTEQKTWRFHRCSSWTSCSCPSSVCGAHGQTVQKTCGIPQVQFLDKLFMPVVGVWCPWPDSAGNCGNAAVSVFEQVDGRPCDLAATSSGDWGFLAPLTTHSFESSRSGGSADAGSFSQVSGYRGSSAQSVASLAQRSQVLPRVDLFLHREKEEEEEEKEEKTSSWPRSTSTRAASPFWCAHRRLRQRHVQGWFSFLVLCSIWLQTGPDARHHGPYGPEGFCCSCRTRTWRCTRSSSSTEWWTFLFYECGFGRPTLEREVQWDACVHSSVAEPTVVSYTVPLGGCTIVAIATVVTSCSSSTDCPGSAALFCWGVCVAMSCGGGFLTPDGAYDSVWDSVKPVTGNYFFNYFQFHEFVRCVCMLNYWFSSIDDICADNRNYFLVQVEGQVFAVRSGSYFCTVS